MEESDSMLVDTMRQYISVPENIRRLGDIRAEQLLDLALKILDYFKCETGGIRGMLSRQQKFRAMAKLNQSLQTTLEAQFELSQLMNPTVPFLRKFILTVINRFGPENNQKSKIQTKRQTIHTSNDSNTKLKEWLNQEWIHPSLATKRPKYKGYILPMTINKAMLKNNINLSAELDNPLLKGNTECILNQTAAKLDQRVREFEANQGFSRRQFEESQIRLQHIIKNNREDWMIGGNSLHKIKKKIMEEKQVEEEVPLPTSVFKKELEVAEQEADKKKEKEEIKPKTELKDEETESDVILNPLEILKKEAESKKHQYESQIRETLNELKQRKQEVERWESEKDEIHQKMISDEEKTAKLKQETTDLKKQVEKRQTILATLEGQKDIEEEVRKFEGEIKTLQNQAKEQVNNLQKEIVQMRTESKQKMEALSDLKAKLNKIQSEYTHICDEIVEKQEIKTNVKINKSGISRIYYHKKISDMESRWKDTQKETNKLKKSLVEVREKTRMSSSLTSKVENEIHNILNVEKTRNQPETKALREMIDKCKQAYSTTMKTLEFVNDVKMQTQDYEVKIHTLSGKNHKQNVKKIHLAMEDLNRQLDQLSKSQLK